MAVRGEQQRAGGLAGAFRSECEDRVPVADRGAGVQDRPPVGFELDPDELAGDPGGGQAQSEGLGGDQGDVGAVGVSVVGDPLGGVDRTDGTVGVVDDLEGLASELDDPVNPAGDVVLGGGVAARVDPAVQHRSTQLGD
ncbi:MAG: hypothetical protein M3291_07045 [Actinomycetota bacterium]|nr:hypothetical protein [Actinomycetota bacterium]